MNESMSASAPERARQSEQAAVVAAALDAHAGRPGGLMPLLHAIQDALGYIPPASVERIASALNLSRAEIHGVLTFYHEFRQAPPGRHVLRLCRAEACQAMGADTLAQAVTAFHGLAFGQTSADGALTLEAVYCLGNCACAPAASLDGRLLGRVTAERLGQLLAEEDRHA